MPLHRLVTEIFGVRSGPQVRPPRTRLPFAERRPATHTDECSAVSARRRSIDPEPTSQPDSEHPGKSHGGTNSCGNPN